MGQKWAIWPILGVFCLFCPCLGLNISESSIPMGKIFWKLINTRQGSLKNANRPRLDEMGGSYGAKTPKNVEKGRLLQLRGSILRELVKIKKFPLTNFEPRTKAIHPCIICPGYHATLSSAQDRCLYVLLRKHPPASRQPLRSIYI